MDALNLIFWLNEGFVPPYQYRDNNTDKLKFEDVLFVWSTNYADNLNIKIENVNNSIGMDKTEIKNYGDGHRPYSSSFRSEVYITEELVEELTNRYQKLIGLLRCSIELVSIFIFI